MTEGKVEQIARRATQIGAIVRRRRRHAGLTQAQLGAKTGLRQATISKLEAGEPATELRTLLDVLTALDLELLVRRRSKANSSDEIAEIF